MQKNRERTVLIFAALLIFAGAGVLVSQGTADIQVRLRCPGQANPGQDLGTGIQVRVRNAGTVAAQRFAVDLVLSKDRNVPVRYAVYTQNFTEDCLLLGGREHEFNLAPGERRDVELNGSNRIPGDTPPGNYWLAVIVDPGDEVTESDEGNNVAFCRIRINHPRKPVAALLTHPVHLASTGIPVPRQLSPGDGTVMTHFPRKVRLRWKAVPRAAYDVEVDCLHCRTVGQWDSENGAPWKTASGVKPHHFDFVFVGDNQGRWRVRAVRGGARSGWSPWWNFSFRTGGSSVGHATGAKPDLGMYGFVKLGKNQRQVKWGDTILLGPADATLVSNGTPAFEVYYSCREFAGHGAGPFMNKLLFAGNLVSQQTSLTLKPEEIRPIHTQAYLGPQNGRLEFFIDAENDVAESREDNNGPFFVNLRFQDFPAQGSQTQRRLPDLVVRDISLVENCKIRVTIANIGKRGVPEEGYDMRNGAAIQMYRMSQPWGGIRLGAVDPGGNLKTPGGSVSWIWFPGAANLDLTPGLHTIRVVVDNNNAVTEANETNNTRTERLNCGGAAEQPATGGSCAISLDRIYPDRGRPGTVFRMYGQWGATQGSKIPAINRGTMHRLEVLDWSPTVLLVRVPRELSRGTYRVGVYCSDPAQGTTASSGWKDFRLM